MTSGYSSQLSAELSHEAGAAVAAAYFLACRRPRAGVLRCWRRRQRLSSGVIGRSIGLDVHRDLCRVAIPDGGRARSAGQIAATPEQLALFGRSLAPADRVLLEATGNALAIARILEPHAAEGVLAHAKQVRATSPWAIG